MSERPEIADWLDFDDARVAAEVDRRRAGGLVVGWPYNGTRRWFAARGGNSPRSAGSFSDYLSLLLRRQAEHHRMLFAHGVRALLVPSFGKKNLARGAEYAGLALGGLLSLGDDAVYRQMFDEGVRLRFYGDYERILPQALGERVARPILGSCRTLEEKTAGNGGPALLIGLFADEPHSTIARLSVEFYTEYGRPPERSELVASYYGEELPGLDMYVGFAKPQLFDVPLLPDGSEQLYVTLNPSPDLSRDQLRLIIYDCLYLRRAAPDYSALGPEGRSRLADELDRVAGQTFGVGTIDPLTGGWTPLMPRRTTPS